MNKQVDVYCLFQSTFGNRPLQYIGRNDVIEQLCRLTYTIDRGVPAVHRWQ